MSNEAVGWNDALRFGLELVALAGWWLFGWNTSEGAPRWLVAILFTVGAGTAWAVFRVPGDPGPAIVAVPGFVRLGLEAVVMIVAGIGLARQYGIKTALVFAAVVAIHYGFDHHRLRTLIQN